MEQEKTLKNKVLESIGAGAMCWDETPTGVLDVKSAVIIGEELMTHIESDIPNAIKALTKALAEDTSEGSYYYTWQANIAMSFYDAVKNHLDITPTGNLFDDSFGDGALHQVSNNAAKNFLNLLIK